jgi:ABC-type amino acid transport substrate-binding protein
MLGASASLVLACALAGCGLSVPADPEGTLDRVSGGVLRVGVTPNGDRVTIDEAGDPSGGDVDLVEGFAETVDADIEWVVGAEEAHVRELESGELDLVIGGITDQTPWLDKAGVTRPYLEITEPDGTRLKLVMLTPMGENAFISELERFLTEHGQEASR